MELSIIVPVYNMAADGKLEYCLNSLLNQTISDFEIIAVDDASTDESPQILLDYAAHYPDVLKVFLCKENKKQGGAKNFGLKHAKGKWIGFIDSDDWIAPDMYEKLLKKAKETGADMVACNYHLTHEHSDAIGQVVRTHYEAQTGPLDEEKYKLLLLDSGSLVIKIYKRRLIYDCGMEFPEHMFYEDNAIANAIVLKATNFAYVDEPLYAYYQHNTSTVHTITKERCEHRKEAARRMRQHAIEFDYLDKYHEEIEFKFTVLFYVNTLFSYLQGTRGKKDIKFLRKLGKEMSETFPNFRANKYYLQRVNEEERTFIDMQQKSTYKMLFWYELKWFVRRLKQKGLKTLLKQGIALILGAAICLAGVFATYQKEQPLAYPVVLFGDSVIANDYVGKELDEMLCESLDKEVFNAGFGGSYLCNQNADFYDTCGDESLSMEELSISIVTGDFLMQKTAIKRASRLHYYEDRLEKLTQIDFNKTDILIIEHGINDYALQIPPEQFEETLTEIVKRFKKHYPNMKLVVSSPTYSYIVRDGENLYCDTYEMGPYLLEEYVDIERKVCEEEAVLFVDNFHDSVIYKENLMEYSLDGLHLNEAGRQVIADNILAALKNSN